MGPSMVATSLNRAFVAGRTTVLTVSRYARAGPEFMTASGARPLDETRTATRIAAETEPLCSISPQEYPPPQNGFLTGG